VERSEAKDLSKGTTAVVFQVVQGWFVTGDACPSGQAGFATLHFALHDVSFWLGGYLPNLPNQVRHGSVDDVYVILFYYSME